MRWPWTRRGISRDEARESREHLALVREQDQAVDLALRQRRYTKNRNGFGALMDEGFTAGRRSS